MTLHRLFVLIMLAGATSACGTVARPAPASTACLALKTLSFAQLPPGQKDDPGNVADSPETVDEIVEHNTRWEALCRKPRN